MTFVCGHRNPDSDSIISAMAYADLCNIAGKRFGGNGKDEAG